ncbi:PREDICTED: putative ribonuclease H protein At1g65750-like [Fragaria vesca subsp. vesca]
MHMEAEALRASLFIAIHQGWDEAEIEGDCATVMKALATIDGDVIEVSFILSDCRHYMEAFRFILLRHVYREANGVAHRLAHLARSSSLNEFWVDEPPDIIQDVLMEDGCNISRGLGSMTPSLYDISLNNNNMGDNI